jgi:hypothetical protein
MFRGTAQSNQDNSRPKFPLELDMAETLHPQKVGNSLAVWAVVTVVAALVLYGIWTFLKSEKHAPNHPPGITHSRPVGGKVQDGVFHPSLIGSDSEAIRWRI